MTATEKTINLPPEGTILCSNGFRTLGYAVWLLVSQGAPVMVLDESTGQWIRVTSIRRGQAAPPNKRPFIITGVPSDPPALP